MNCSLAFEDEFGPQARDCYGGYDFTLLFEESVMTIGPVGLLLLFLARRVIYLYRKSTRDGSSDGAHLAKLMSYGWFAAIQTAILVSWTSGHELKTRTTIPAAALNLVAALALGLASHFEHTRSVKPPLLIEIYLLFTLAFDAVRLRTLWAMGYHGHIFKLLMISDIWKAVLLVQEAWSRALGSLEQEYSPEEKVGWINRRMFWWVNPLLFLGSKKDLQADDLFTLNHSLQSEVCSRSFSKVWQNANPATKEKSNGLLKVLAWEYKLVLLTAAIPRLCFTAFTFAQPFLIDAVIKYLQTDSAKQRRNDGYGLLGAYILVYVGLGISEACYQHITYRTIVLMRGCLVPLIYEKTLSMDPKTAEEYAPVTLMSADIEKIAFGMRYMHEAWGNIVEIALALWLLYRELNYGGLSPILIAVVCGAAAATMAPAVGRRQATWVQGIQKRIDVTTYMINSMKSLKLEGLTPWFMKFVQDLRVQEIGYASKFRSFLTYAVSLSFATSVISPVVGFGIFIALSRYDSGPELTTQRAFTTLSLFTVLQNPMSMLLQAVPNLISAVGSIERVRVFLMAEDTKEVGFLSSFTSEQTLFPEMDNIRDLEMKDTEMQNAVEAQNWSVGWVSTREPVIKRMTFKIRPSSLTIITGPTGCGKSTLLAGLRGETAVTKGYMKCRYPEAAFCSQEPWLQNGTILSNILGPLTYEPRWFREVTQASGLRQDLRSMPMGVQTVVGSKGLSLSGGQKHRVALARALYSRQPLLLLDDIFSGFDAETEKLVIARLFSEGGFCTKHNLTTILATHSTRLSSNADYTITLDSKVHFSEKEGSIVSSLPGPSTGDHPMEPILNDARLSWIVRQSNPDVPHELAAQLETSDSSRRTGDVTIYKYYLDMVGRFNSFLFFVAVAIFTFSLAFPSVWVQWWAAANEKHPYKDLSMYIGVYAFLAVMAELSLFLGCWHMISNMVPRASRKLHKILLRTVLNAPISFFHSTDSGVTTNKFSQDMQLVDMELPLALVETSVALMSAIAQLLIVFITGKYLAAIIPLCLAVFYFLQKFYLRTSRQLRFMELEAKSPLYSNFMETVNGLVTIRAFGWQNNFLNNICGLTDASQRPYYLLFVIQRWLTLVLDMVVAGMATLIVGLAVGVPGSIGAGSAALGLLNIISLSESLKQLISNWTVLETSIGAVSRVRQFEDDVQPEDRPDGHIEVPPRWPERGDIKFFNVSAAYRPDSDPVLNDVTLSISAGEMVAICGPSGSGKSSLIQLLFRLLEPDNGQITIDGLDINSISCQDIRSSLSCISQSVTILPGTVRQNIDPLSRETDESITNVLKEVKLWDIVSTQLGGLDGQVQEESFSQGQKQLLRLAAAMLRKSKVVVLDEATSSVDPETDALMQRLIRTAFAGCTVIAVVHRLHTIIDFHKVVVVESGRIVECGAPKELLAENGLFSQLYGKGTATPSVGPETSWLKV
ncbi:P-loop containing nucleoside triphosphate hydrolase protein [Aspergillus sclerotioniger CBS 115572]|uniref:P-loop containing nucleoside triphosphate hydrolase protein n=1 Tax=Aspergillus sclerotioniger CBS 115572 TaxID=1450535 RepID=A0A317WNH4_9EURO|nr:P-loop containing nucleoside triphosphate hydrolase protein [Aspergillus sclerotioniger CBS 115572]PWY86607.1 P-loop containing nucleoside triphosphate hydrolase protein [Aspergillus sclerotioniger CBS 115572]